MSLWALPDGMADETEAQLAAVRGTLDEIHRALLARLKTAEAAAALAASDLAALQSKFDVLTSRQTRLVATLKSAMGEEQPAPPPPTA